MKTSNTIINFRAIEKTFCYLLFLFVANASFAQSNECLMQGYILDKETGNGVPYVQIRKVLANTSSNTNLSKENVIVTNGEGYFEMLSEISVTKIVVTSPGKIDTCDIPKDPCSKTLIFSITLNSSYFPEVKVTGFRNDTGKEKVAAAIGYVDQKNFQSTDQTSLQNTVNTIPGVIMESRGFGGSHRLSIRGSSLRAPFAVRNIKMYMEGIPLTSPDGQAPLEMIDAGEISSMEVIKGPAGSIWGSGNGGVLLFKPKKAVVGTTRVGTGFQAGSYDIYRSSTFAEIGMKQSGLRISHVWQDSKGYRDQEFNHKNQINLSFYQYLNEKQKIFVYATYYKGRWGLPGALTAAQAEDDPTQAVKFSKDNNAYLSRGRLFSGASHQITFGKYLQATTSFYYYSTIKNNPYGTSNFNSGYKEEGSDGFGGRTDWQYLRTFGQWKLKVNVGGEWQPERYHITESKISNGQPGDFKYFYDIGYINSMVFGSAEIAFHDNYKLEIGNSLNFHHEDIRGYAGSWRYDTTKTLTSQNLPRLAISAMVVKGINAFASLSNGNSNPTAFEMVDYENNKYNFELRPEQGQNMEYGVKGNLNQAGLQFEFNYYQFRLKDAIISKLDTSFTDLTGLNEIYGYHNIGSTLQNGLEWSIVKTFLQDNKRVNMRIWTSGSAYDYKFKDYTIEEEQLSGKRLPGVPLYNVSNGLDATFFKSIQLNVSHYWYDKMPLDNSNTTWSKAYNLLNARIGYSRTFFKKLDVQLYAGMNNITNTKYSSFFGLNGTGGKYYNPMAPGNYFGGVNLAWVVR